MSVKSVSLNVGGVLNLSDVFSRYPGGGRGSRCPGGGRGSRYPGGGRGSRCPGGGRDSRCPEY